MHKVLSQLKTVSCF